MVLRRRTVGLLVLLLGVGLLSLLHHRRVEWSFSKYEVTSGAERPESAFYAPTPGQIAATFAAIRTPRGFYRARSCWLSGKEVACWVHFPSIPLSHARVEALLSEAGVKPITESLSHLRCEVGHRRPLKGTRNLHFMHCGDVETFIGRAFVTVSAHALVQRVHGHILGTARTFQPANRFAPSLRGTELDFWDYGVPREARG